MTKAEVVSAIASHLKIEWDRWAGLGGGYRIGGLDEAAEAVLALNLNPPVPVQGRGPDLGLAP